MRCLKSQSGQSTSPVVAKYFLAEEISCNVVLGPNTAGRDCSVLLIFAILNQPYTLPNSDQSSSEHSGVK